MDHGKWAYGFKGSHMRCQSFEFSRPGRYISVEIGFPGLKEGRG